MINRFYVFFVQKNGNKYLCIDDESEILKKYNQVLMELNVLLRKLVTVM